VTPERWHAVSDELDKALRMQATERSPYLARLAVVDPELHREVESLLASHQKATAEFLRSPIASNFSDPESSRPSATMLNRRVGAYQIVELIGTGGMGEVYRAFRADDEYRKQVALKVVRAGEGSSFVISRFKNERQILASLDHPNIARLLDGGTTDDGAPYFVMELIGGESIDHYCDHHKLATNDRLNLFLQVCSAVQFAHQRLIVHRDIKPGNILVTAESTPKLLDFGIAKILEADAIEEIQPTMTLFRMLTPGYASPEQIKGEPITTASDVYSLGVVLYELLTGRSPYRVTSRSPRELAQAVCEFEPEKPSTAVLKRPAEPREGSADSDNRDSHSGSLQKLGRRLRGDLDNIVLMALRKEPQRRYASVEQFASDIRRHLENLPVIARKDTARYRAVKFVTRHKAGVFAALSVAVILLGALAITLHEARIAKQQAELARQQRARAERRFNDVRKLANSLIFEIHDSIATLPGATKAREVLVKRALEYLDSLSHESADPALQRELAAAYDRIGDVQGNNGMPNLNDFSGASASYAKALAIRESLAAGNPNDASLRPELMRSYFEAAIGFEMVGDFDSDLRAMQKAQPLVSVLPRGTGLGQQQFSMSGVYYFSGKALEKTGHWDEALENYQKAASQMEPVAFAPQASLIPRAYLARQYVTIGKVMAELGRTSEGLASATKGLNMFRKLAEDNPTNAPLREGLDDVYSDFVDVLIANGSLERALNVARLTRKLRQEVVTTDPANKMAEADLAWGDLLIAEIFLRQGKPEEAAPMAREALSIFQEGNPANKYWHAVEMGQAYLDLGKINAALAKGAGLSADKRKFWTDASSCYQNALDSRSTGPGQLDSNGHDQIGEIRTELAKANAALHEPAGVASHLKPSAPSVPIEH
jgi:serine/threonine protein kinase/tetratricopeptide (TPR) repeat protein